jgi:hypothetical protein
MKGWTEGVLPRPLRRMMAPNFINILKLNHERSSYYCDLKHSRRRIEFRVAAKTYTPLSTTGTAAPPVLVPICGWQAAFPAVIGTLDAKRDMPETVLNTLVVSNAAAALASRCWQQHALCRSKELNP